jgi:catechol 2,3-dioxygenase-like lactoylglutathione lyase family enzyme
MGAILSTRFWVAVLTEIALFTDDVEALVGFYRRVLDREPTASWPGGATFDLGGITLLIHVRGEPQAGMPPNTDHFALRVEDVDSEAARLGAEARDYDWGRSAYLTDPDGRLVELQ